MAPRSSPTPPSPPPTPQANRESYLERKKREIVEKSMARFTLSLDRCLDKAFSSAPATAGAAARAGAALGTRKRGREDDEDGGPGDVNDSHGGEKAKKKKVNPNGKKFACPFAKHDPAGYQSTKTCCGPGWDDVHRVKEHVYRRHLSKNFCPRCFSHFEKAEEVQEHLQGEVVACKVQKRSPHAITEEQEKQLRTRAKPGCSEEDRWKEMYQIIFPDDKDVPSPYYDSGTDSTLRSARSQFKNPEEARNSLRDNILSHAWREMEKYVDAAFEEFQDKISRKMVEVIRDIETKVLSTYLPQEEQTPALPAATTPDILGAGTCVDAAPAASNGLSTPPNEHVEGLAGSDAPQLLNGLFNELYDDLWGMLNNPLDQFNGDLTQSFPSSF